MFGVVRVRLYKYLLKRLFGRYLDEDLDSVKISVNGESVNIRNLHLRFDNGLFESNVVFGYAKSVTVNIPWRNLQSGCRVIISGLAIDINAGGRPENDTSDTDSNSSSCCDDTYLHRTLLRLFNRDYSTDNFNSAEEDDVTRQSHRKSIDCVTEYIHAVFCKTIVEVLDARLNLLIPNGNYIFITIPTLRFRNGILELCNGAELYDGQVSARLLTIYDSVYVDLNDETVICNISSIQGLIPIDLLFNLQCIPLNFSEWNFVSRETAADEPSSITRLVQIKINVKNVAVVLQSGQSRFSLLLRNVHFHTRVIPEFYLELCSADEATLMDEVNATQFITFAKRSSPIFLLSSNRLHFEGVQLRLEFHTLYRLKNILQECFLRAKSLRTECSEIRPDFIISLAGPTVLQYKGYFDMTIDSEIVVIFTPQSGSLAFQSSLRIRNIQQDPVLVLSTRISCRTKFTYGSCFRPIPCVPLNSKRTSRIFQFGDFDPIEIDLKLPTYFRETYLNSVKVSSCWKADHLDFHFNENAIVGLYWAIKKQSRQFVSSGMNLGEIPFSWAITFDVQKIKFVYITCSSSFTVISPNGLSMFGSSELLSLSCKSLSLLKGSSVILSHIACLEGCSKSNAAELTILSRNEQIEHSLSLRNIILTLGHNALDLIESGISFCTSLKTIHSDHSRIDESCRKNWLNVFRFNLDDCAIRLSQMHPSACQLTLAVEKLKSTFCVHQLHVLLGGLSLHHLKDKVTAVVADSRLHVRSTLSESLMDSGEIVVMLLDMAEGDSHSNSASLNLGHITFMTSAETFTSSYQAIISFLEHIFPRLSTFAMSASPGDSSFSVSRQHGDAMLLSSNEILLPKISSGGQPSHADCYEDSLEDLRAYREDCHEIDNDAICKSDAEQSVASFMQESYEAVAAAKLPNQHEMKAQYLSCDFDLVETHFTTFRDEQNRNHNNRVDEKILDSDTKDPELHFTINLSIESVILRLFGGCYINSNAGSRSLLNDEKFDSLQECFFGIYGQRHKAANDLIEIVIRGSQVRWQSYTSSSEHTGSHKFDGTLASIIINDHVKESHFSRVVGPLINKKHHGGEHYTRALVVTIESVKSASYCAEHRVEVHLDPLDVTLDGATLVFALEFANGIESVLEQVVATPIEGELDTVQIQVNLDPTVYVHFFECDATSLNVTYRPTNSDFSSIQYSADFIKLLQMLPVQNARFELKRVFLRGLSGYTRVFCEMFQIWIRDIARNQYHRYLASIVPFASVMKIGDSIRDSIQKCKFQLTQLFSMLDKAFP